MDIKRLMQDYYYLCIELREYERVQKEFIEECNTIQKYITIPNTTLETMKKLYAFYDKRCKYIAEQINKADSLFNSLNEPYYTIMKKRYKERKTLEVVADETYYSYKSVSKKIKEAFEILGGVENERDRTTKK